LSPENGLPEERPEEPVSSGEGEPVPAEADSRSAPFWRYQDVLLAVGLAIPIFVLAFGATLAVLHLVPWRLSDGAKILLPQFTGYAFALAPVVLLFRWKYDRPFWASVAGKVEPSSILPSISSGIFLAILILVSGAVLRPPEIESPLEDLMDDPKSAILVAFFASTLGPVFEELFFRGLLQPLLIRSAGVIAGILLAAVPFALLHGPQYAWSWRHLLLIMMAGAGFGWRRYATGSTASAAIMHAGYNATLVGGYLVGRNQF
jgi:membrane protease YdiL (CAAX protease family)